MSGGGASGGEVTAAPSDIVGQLIDGPLFCFGMHGWKIDAAGFLGDSCVKSVNFTFGLFNFVPGLRLTIERLSIAVLFDDKDGSFILTPADDLVLAEAKIVNRVVFEPQKPAWVNVTLHSGAEGGAVVGGSDLATLLCYRAIAVFVTNNLYVDVLLNITFSNDDFETTMGARLSNLFIDNRVLNAVNLGSAAPPTPPPSPPPPTPAVASNASSAPARDDGGCELGHAVAALNAPPPPLDVTPPTPAAPAKRAPLAAWVIALLASLGALLLCGGCALAVLAQRRLRRGDSARHSGRLSQTHGGAGGWFHRRHDNAPSREMSLIIRSGGDSAGGGTPSAVAGATAATATGGMSSRRVRSRNDSLAAASPLTDRQRAASIAHRSRRASTLEGTFGFRPSRAHLGGGVGNTPTPGGGGEWPRGPFATTNVGGVVGGDGVGGGDVTHTAVASTASRVARGSRTNSRAARSRGVSFHK